MAIPLEVRFEMYERVETALREFFEADNFCLRECISQRTSFFGFPGQIGCCGDDYSSDLQIYDVEERECFLIKQAENSDPAEGNDCRYHGLKGCQIRKFRTPICNGFACYQLKEYLSENYNVEFSSFSTFSRLNEILNGERGEGHVVRLVERIEKATVRIRNSERGSLLSIDGY